MGINRIVHFEIHAADGDKLQKFYEDVFGWEFTQFGPEMGNYRVIKTGPGPGEPIDPKQFGINGGMTVRHGPAPALGQPVNAYVCVIGVDDIAPYPEKIKAAGGKIALELMDVPGVGKLFYGLDLENNIFGVLEPTPMA